MYKAFYGLREKPFNLTPDPRFLYLSDKHKEAFAHLLYGIRSRSGFVMVTGEIGTGKTTICRNLLNQLDEDTEVAFIFNPMLSPIELLRKIVSEFGIDVKGSNALEITEELNEYLLEAAAKGKNCVLLIDEAQNLDPQVLEQIRLLSNLETETEKLLQIVLIGQPELGEKLELHELRQLNQRITARYHLKPLSEKEVMQYVAYRLHVAGGRRSIKFAKPAIRAVYKISKGTPRVINAICDRALLIGFTREVHTITKSIIYRAHREIRGDAVFGRQAQKWSFRQWALHPVSAVVALCIAAAIFLNSPALQSGAADLAGKLMAALPSKEAAPPDPVKNVAEATTVQAADDNSLRSETSPPLPAVALPETPDSASQPEAATAKLPLAEGAPATDLQAVLAGLSAAETDKAALRDLLNAWGRTSDALPDRIDDATLDRVLRSESWSYDRLKPALNQLVALGLPALMKVVVNGEPRWVALTAVAGDTFTVSAGADAPVSVSREGLQAIYAAEAIIPWEDPSPGAATLREGSSSGAVAELKSKLRQLDRLRADNTSELYDVETASAVSRVQAETSLEVDGIAGKQVRMVLSSWLREAGTPSLTSPRPVPAVEKLAKQAPVAPTKPEVKAEVAEETPVAAPAPVGAPEVVIPAPVETTPAPEATAPAPVEIEPAPEAATPAETTPEPSAENVVEAAPEVAEPAPAAETKASESASAAPAAESDVVKAVDPVADVTEVSPESPAEAETKEDGLKSEPPAEAEVQEDGTVSEAAANSTDSAEPVTLTNINREDSADTAELASDAGEATETSKNSTSSATITSASGVQLEVKELSDPDSAPTEDTPEADESDG